MIMKYKKEYFATLLINNIYQIIHGPIPTLNFPYSLMPRPIKEGFLNKETTSKFKPIKIKTFQSY